MIGGGPYSNSARSNYNDIFKGFQRESIKAKGNERLSFTEVAERFGISRVAVFRWSKNIECKNGQDRQWKIIDLQNLELPSR